MILVHANIDKEFDFEKNPIQELVVENSNEYYLLTTELYQQECGESGEWVLSFNNDIKDISKNVLIIHNFYELDCTGKKVESLITSCVLNELKTNDYTDLISQLNVNFFAINDKITENIDLPIVQTKELTYEDFIKFMGYKIEKQEDILSKIITYIEVFVKIKNIKLVVIFNITAILTDEQISLLIKQFEYMQVSVLFLNRQGFLTQIIPKTIVDNDLCVI